MKNNVDNIYHVHSMMVNVNLFLVVKHIRIQGQIVQKYQLIVFQLKMNLCVYKNQSIVFKYLIPNIVDRLIINKAVKNHVNGKTINVNS